MSFDDKEFREPFEQDLGEGGYQVHIATIGQEALGDLGEKEINLLVLELGLPDMSGKEAMRQVVLIYPETQVVIC